MKWTTKTGGKKETHYIDSGVVHNPAPRTERGKRRAESKAEKKGNKK